MHPTKLIKVNAWVDEGLAPLVSALNEIPGVVTLDSCQENQWGSAHVFFAYGQDWTDTGNLLQRISSLLAESCTRCVYLMRLEWLGSNDRARGLIAVRTEDINGLAQGIRAITQDLTSALRSSPCGIAGKEPDSCSTCPNLPLLPA